MPFPVRSLFLCLVPVLAFCAAAPAQAQPLRCELNGEPVNPSNGGATAGKTGLMRCRTQDGNLQREEELRNGKFMGKRVFYSRDGRKEDGVNEKGNMDGAAREFYTSGKLKEEARYANGERVGLLKRYFESGQLERLSFAASGKGADYDRGASLEYLEDGRLRGIQCGTRSLMPEDRAPCGFNGSASQVELFRAGRSGVRLDEKRSFRDGTLVERIAFNEDGKPASSLTVKDGMETTRDYFPDGKPRRERAFTKDAGGRGREGTEREWASNGQMTSERHYAAGLETTASEWFMNGSLRQKRVTEGSGREALVRIEFFFDTGKLRGRETTRAGRPLGKAERFDEAGTLREESVYGERGTLKSRKTFDEHGKLTADEEFFEDGSRKLKN
jgi:antitoxin component YwqK of YwqJK toxin-antitoxin module